MPRGSDRNGREALRMIAAALCGLMQGRTFVAGRPKAVYLPGLEVTSRSDERGEVRIERSGMGRDRSSHSQELPAASRIGNSVEVQGIAKCPRLKHLPWVWASIAPPVHCAASTPNRPSRTPRRVGPTSVVALDGGAISIVPRRRCNTGRGIVSNPLARNTGIPAHGGVGVVDCWERKPSPAYEPVASAPFSVRRGSSRTVD